MAQIERSESSLQNANQWEVMQNQAIRTLNQMGRAKGLPSYEQFHQNNGVVYQMQPGQGILGIERSLPAIRGLIPEDTRQIEQNLSHSQRPLMLSDQLRNWQMEMAAERVERQNQRQQQWTRQKVGEIMC